MQVSIASRRAFAPFIGSITEATGNKDRGVRLTVLSSVFNPITSTRTLEKPSMDMEEFWDPFG
jgi:hypothetical protein